MLPGWAFIIMLSYGIPCFVLYTIILYHFVHPKYKHNFNGAFFKISTCVGVMDLIEVVVSFPQTKMPLCPLFAVIYNNIKPGYWICVLLFLCHYIIYSRMYFLVANAFNRFTAIKYPHKHNYYWSIILKPVIAVCFVLGIPGSYHFLASEPLILPFYVNRTDSFVLDGDFTLYKMNNSFNGAIQALLTGSLAFLLNLSTVFLLTKAKIQSSKKISKTETSLFFIALWDFFLQLIWLAHQVSVYTFVIREDFYNPIFDTLYLVTPWIVDLLALSQPFIILKFCKKSRIIFTMNVKKPNIVVSSTLQSSTININSVHLSVAPQYLNNPDFR